MKKILLSTLSASLLLPVLALAQSAFVGTWKMDVSNNIQMPKKPYSYLVANGVFHCQICMPPYSVKADGQDHKVTGHYYYDSVSIKIIDDNTLSETDKKSGKTVTVSTYKVAADGATMTYETNDSSNSNADPIKMRIEFSRVAKAPAGSHAISGSWRAVKFDSMSDNGTLVTYALEATNLKMTSPTGQSYSAPLDGTDSPFNGDPGQTSVSMKRIDDRTIEETDRRNGKVIGSSKLTVSADGKTMTVAWKDMLHGDSGSFTNIKQ